MHETLNISHSVQWPLSRKTDACWEENPMPEDRASIPDNWLCISDWQITHQLLFGQREKRESKRERERWRIGRGMWKVHTFQSSWKNTKQPDPLLDVRECQCLYYNKNRLSHNCPHHNTYTHIHRACAQSIIVHYSSSMTTVSQGRCEYTSNSATCFCQNASIFS